MCPTEQPKEPSQEQDGAEDTALCQQLADEVSLQDIIVNKRRRSGLKVLGDRRIALQLQKLRQMGLFARGTSRQNDRPSLFVRFRSLLTACTPHRFLANASRIDHDSQVPRAERTGWCTLFVEWGNSGRQSREGGLEDHTS